MVMELCFLQARALFDWTCAGPLGVGLDFELVTSTDCAVLGFREWPAAVLWDAAPGDVSLLPAATV
jgi:hypothetical protein